MEAVELATVVLVVVVEREGGGGEMLELDAIVLFCESFNNAE